MTQIKLIIAVFGDLLNPEAFSKIAKLEPTVFWVKGDHVPSRNINIKRKETCWEYSFDFIQTLFFDEVANLVLEKFSQCIEDIAKYIKENNLETKIDIVVEIVNNESPSISFDKKFMDLVSMINGEIDIDLYILDI